MEMALYQPLPEEASDANEESHEGFALVTGGSLDYL
jgi:hypothetical protein